MDNPSLSFKGQSEEDIFQEKLKASRPKGLINGDKDIIFRMDRDLKGDSLLLPVKEKNGSIEEKGSVAKEEKILAMLSYVRERVEEDCKRILEGEKVISLSESPWIRRPAATALITASAALTRTFPDFPIEAWTKERKRRFGRSG